MPILPADEASTTSGLATRRSRSLRKHLGPQLVTDGGPPVRTRWLMRCDRPKGLHG